MNAVTISILLLLISGMVGAFLYIKKLRATSAENTKKLQEATAQVSSLRSDVSETKAEAEEASKKLENEKKAKKAELMRIDADSKAEKARRDALEKMKDAKIAELTEKKKRQEAEIAKTEARRQAALKEADAARAKAKAARTQADRAIGDAKRAKDLANRAKRVADQRAKQAGIEIGRAKTQQARAAKDAAMARQKVAKAAKDAAMARQRVAKAAKDVASARAQVRGVNIKRTFEDAARYDAVPGYYTKGHVWAGDHFNVSDPNVCKSIARNKKLAVWGHRNNLHPDKRYKNSCYFYKSGPKYAGNGNDRIHMIGCTFGGNPKTGCVQPKREPVFKWGAYWKGLDFPGNDIWTKSTSAKRGLSRTMNRVNAKIQCKKDNRCAALTCNNSGSYCWAKSKLGKSRRHGDRNTWRADRN